MNISQYFDPNHPYFFYILGSAILLVYIVVSRRGLNNRNDSEFTESDISKPNSNDDAQIPKGIEHFTKLDNSLKWKTVLLVALIIIGLYLVIFVRK